MFWMYCLVTRRKDGTYTAHRNETEQWTLRGLSWAHSEEAWLFQESIDGSAPASLYYHLLPGTYKWDPELECLPPEARALVAGPEIRRASAE